MPVHDWTRAEKFLVHSFQLAWRVHLSESLNCGLLPESHYSQTASVTLPAASSRTYAKGHIVVHRLSDHRPVAEIEIVEPADKSDPAEVDAFARRVAERISAGVHLLVIDLFPPGRHDSSGIHREIWNYVGNRDETLADKPLSVVTYRAGTDATAYLMPLQIGDPLPTMPLFFSPDRYVNLPLEPAYEAAWKGTPAFWRAVVEGRESAP